MCHSDLINICIELISWYLPFQTLCARMHPFICHVFSQYTYYIELSVCIIANAVHAQTHRCTRTHTGKRAHTHIVTDGFWLPLIPNFRCNVWKSAGLDRFLAGNRRRGPVCSVHHCVYNRLGKIGQRPHARTYSKWPYFQKNWTSLTFI